MTWFDLCFPQVMLVLPLTVVLLLRRGPEGSQSDQARDRARGLTLLLAVATLLCMGIHLYLWWRGVSLNRLMFVFLFPLWFGLAMPALAAKNPDFVHAHPGGTSVRRASLAPRDHSELAPRWLWAASIATAALLLIATALRPMGDSMASALGITGVAPFDDAAQSTWWRSLVIQIAVSVFTFAMLWGCIGMIRREPEPMDARGSVELVDAYAALRRFKAAAFLWLFGICSNALFGLAFMFVAWMPPDQRSLTLILAIGGGAAGSLLGIAGAVIGIMASSRRARITHLIRTLDAQRGAVGSV